MAVILPNATVDIWRATYNATTGRTSKAQLLYPNVSCHVDFQDQPSYLPVDPGGLKLEFTISFDPTIDCVANDLIVNIRSKNGVSVWPDDQHGKVTWTVVVSRLTPPGPLQQKMAHLERFQGAGPA